MTVLLKLILGWLMRWFSQRWDDAYESALRDQRNKRVVLDEVKEILNEASRRNEDIAAQPESVADSMLRLKRLAAARESGESIDGGAKWTSPFRGYDPGRAGANQDSIPSESSAVPSPESGGGGEAGTTE